MVDLHRVTPSDTSHTNHVVYKRVFSAQQATRANNTSVPASDKNRQHAEDTDTCRADDRCNLHRSGG